MKNLLLIIVLIFFYLGNAYSQSNTRAMWVWGSTTSIIEYSSSRDAFYNFCNNPPGMNNPNAVSGFPRAINLVFISAHGYVVGDSAQRAKLHAFLKDAHSRNMKVEYLDGDKSWATTNISSGELYLDDVIKFNSEASDPSERFDGIQYDVEPYLNSGWSDPTTRMQIWAGFMQLMSYCQTKVDSLNDGTYFGVAIPRWYDNTPGITYLHQLQDLVDYVAIMDYVDTSSRIISDAGAEIVYADQIGKRAIVGVETQSVDPSSSTFYEEGWGNMEGQLYLVDQYFKNHPGYGGIAIHHYDYYKMFPQWGSAGQDITPPALIDGKFVSGRNGNYFQFHVVDICGTGLNADSTIAYSKVINSTSGGTSVPGTWKKDSANYISFYPSGNINNNDKYSFTIHAVDSAGNSADINDNISAVITDVNTKSGNENFNFKLMQNYPNPFNPTTQITFTLNKAGYTTLKIYDVLGREIETLTKGFLNAGVYNITFNGNKLASGVYVYALTSGFNSSIKKMILSK